MRSTEDIQVDYLLVEKAIGFLMEKLAEYEQEYQTAYAREEKLIHKVKKAKSKMREVYEKGKLIIK